METKEFVENLSSVPQEDRALAVAQATKALSTDEQKVVATSIDKGAWPQNSMHRMLTIVLSIFLALGAGGLAIGANAAGAKDISTALVALSTAIVGGIFGHAQAGN
jgi:hypothetical protein